MSADLLHQRIEEWNPGRLEFYAAVLRPPLLLDGLGQFANPSHDCVSVRHLVDAAPVPHPPASAARDTRR